MLTEKENLILKYICCGYSNKQIGELLGISSHTAKAHVCSILRKFDVSNRVALAFYIANNNLLDESADLQILKSYIDKIKDDETVI